MKQARDFLDLSAKELGKALCEGHDFDPSELDDFEYRGISLGLWGWVEKLTWKKFMKTFHRDPSSGALRGWNVRIEQTPLDDPAWEPMIKKGDVFSFGHYEVVRRTGYRVPAPLERGVMIDYGRGGNGLFDPTRCMRDPLVAVNPGSSDLLLGWSYVDLGLFRFGTPSFFVLERHGPLSHHARPPRTPAAER